MNGFGGPGGFLPSDTVNGGSVSNFNSSNLKHWRAAIARVRAGTGRARLLVIGDSTSMGTGTGSGSHDLVGAFPTSWPQCLARIANPFVPFSSNSFQGDQGVENGASVNLPQYDTRVTWGTGWGGAALAFGGDLMKFASGSGSGTLGFTPAGTFDTFIVFYLQQPSQGTIAVNVDGGASLGTLTCTNATDSYASTTFTCTKGTHSINLVANNNGTCFVGGILAYDSTTPAVDFIQAAVFGATVATFVANSMFYSSLLVQPLLGADLTIINLTVNDSNNATALASYISGLQALITAAQTSGDVLLMVGPPSNTIQATNGTLDQYVAAVAALAAANGCVMLNLKQRWQSYAVTNPIMPYYDSLHPTALGYQDIAQAVYEVIGRP